jgi:hypothetical protein
LTQAIRQAPVRKRKVERIDTNSGIRTAPPAEQAGSDQDLTAGERSSSSEIGSQSAADKDG